MQRAAAGGRADGLAFYYCSFSARPRADGRTGDGRTALLKILSSFSARPRADGRTEKHLSRDLITDCSENYGLLFSLAAFLQRKRNCFRFQRKEPTRRGKGAKVHRPY